MIPFFNEARLDILGLPKNTNRAQCTQYVYSGHIHHIFSLHSM